MRNAFAAEMTELAAKDSRIALLSGDIGNRLFDSFKEKYPERFFNCGVAEANMTGMAAGMALCGLHPITYTIAPFNTFRCLEQIRVDICYHNLPVIIVGVGAGLSYAGLGATHHSCEDIAILRALPNMTVICPGDAIEVRLAIRKAVEYARPTYVRLGKKNEPIIHKNEPVFDIGKAIIIQEGSDICLLGTGNILPVVLETAAFLEEKGISSQVVNMHTVKPLDAELLREAFAAFNLVVTIEEHSRFGGFGGAVAEWLSEQKNTKARLLRCGIDDIFIHRSGDQEHARKSVGLEPEQISKNILNILES